MLRGRVGSRSSDVEGVASFVLAGLVGLGVVFEEKEGGARCGWAA
jgi:hypothetical protein